MTDEQIKQMVDKFLAWELPRDFVPDAGIKFTPTDQQKNNVHSWPVGTNLLTATQAEYMIRYITANIKS